MLQWLKETFSDAAKDIEPTEIKSNTSMSKEHVHLTSEALQLLRDSMGGGSQKFDHHVEDIFKMTLQAYLQSHTLDERQVFQINRRINNVNVDKNVNFFNRVTRALLCGRIDAKLFDEIQYYVLKEEDKKIIEDYENYHAVEHEPFVEDSSDPDPS